MTLSFQFEIDFLMFFETSFLWQFENITLCSIKNIKSAISTKNYGVPLNHDNSW